jgi:hypothetical protein
VDERVKLYIGLENGACFNARIDGEYVELIMEEGTGAADWSAKMILSMRYGRMGDAQKLRDWLVANVKD